MSVEEIVGERSPLFADDFVKQHVNTKANRVGRVGERSVGGPYAALDRATSADYVAIVERSAEIT